MPQATPPKSKLRRTEDPYQYFAFQIFKQALADIKYGLLPHATPFDKYWGRQANGWITKHTGTYNLLLLAGDLEPFDFEPSHFHSWCLDAVMAIKDGKAEHYTTYLQEVI